VTRFRSLQDLQPLRQHLAQAHAQALAQAERRREVARRQLAQKNLFALAVGPVTPLRNGHALVLRRQLPQPVPTQRQLDEAAVLHEALSDEFDVSTLLDTDAELSFRRPGVGRDVTTRLRGGHWSIQRQLDLHGLRSDEAREALGRFIREAHQQGLRCLRVVHGKGLGSPGREPVLKHKVHSWLVQKSQVLAFAQARPAEGGAGALVVLLQPRVIKKDSNKRP
jgi:DNA-nicking Smr family endonuclease